MRKYLFIISLFTFFAVGAQEHTRKDSLRGTLNPLRTCYDVTFYDLFVIIDEQEHSIERSYNIIHFTATNDLNKLQIDLAQNMEVMLVEFEDKQLEFDTEFDAVYIHFPRVIKKGENTNIKVWYGGYPRKAVNAPWDGGFSWKKDDNGKPWIGVSCQGLGASTWWPCKDHQSDEPDSMRITCLARHPLKVIANGNLRKDTAVWSNYLNCWLTQSEWFVANPINNYDVSINIGDYAHFSDTYINNTDTLALDYYVLSYNEQKAREHFKQVKPMMACFERFFGPYPFWEDGYALVETPYLGMEHQSAIAYGNNYLPGYHGNKDFIAGLDFDFIIIHETGHEWWGNSITTNDIADMWVHEGFCTYAEVLYVECMHGYDVMLDFVNNQKRRIRNDKPVIGPYGVNKGGSGDMYNKGSLMLHTLRTLLENDTLWFSIIRGIADDFKHQTIDGQEIIDYINLKSGYDFTDFFEQYLQHKDLPELQYKLQKTGKAITLMYRWQAIEQFDMPVLINTGSEDFWIYPNKEWQELSLGQFDIHDFRVKEELFLMDIKKM